MTSKPKFKIGDFVIPILASPKTALIIQEVKKDYAGSGIHRYYGRYIYPTGAGEFGYYETQLNKIKAPKLSKSKFLCLKRDEIDSTDDLSDKQIFFLESFRRETFTRGKVKIKLTFLEWNKEYKKFIKGIK